MNLYTPHLFKYQQKHNKIDEFYHIPFFYLLNVRKRSGIMTIKFLCDKKLGYCFTFLCYNFSIQLKTIFLVLQ